MGLRYGSKVDANQAKIVRELRATGFRVDLVHRLKKLYDIVVTGRHGFSLPNEENRSGTVSSLRVEIKMPGEKLTIDEQEYWDAEPFQETLIIAYETEDILRWFGRI